MSGKTIDGPAGFREALLNQGNGEFVRTVSEKLLTYALGRGLSYHDAPIVRRLQRDLARDNYRWSSLVLGIVRSAAFQMRRTSVPVETTAPAAAVAERR
jgi:hypothetical protein